MSIKRIFDVIFIQENIIPQYETQSAYKMFNINKEIKLFLVIKRIKKILNIPKTEFKIFQESDIL
ncbi:MAG: hypothetical protein ACW98D_16815 [Promethearchaeota archaeon]|jgi:hypothetical protein